MARPFGSQYAGFDAYAHGGSAYAGFDASAGGSIYAGGSSPPPFVPTDIAGLKLWLAADVGVTVDGSSNVTGWADQSDAGNDAGPAVNSPPGNFVLTPNSFGTKPGLVSASGAELASTTNIVPLGNARTIFVVANVASADSGCVFLSTCPSAHLNTAVFATGLWNFSNAGTVYPYTDGIAVSESTAASPSSFEGAAKVFAYRFGGSGKIAFGVDGDALAALSGADYSSEGGGSGSGYLIGSFVAASLQGWFKGVLGEVLVYDSALSDDDLSKVRGF